MNRKWTEEDYTILRESWGLMKGGMPALAKKLNRSVNALKVKAHRLKLGPWLDADEYVTLNQLLKLFCGKSWSYSYSRWRKLGVPVRKKRCIDTVWDMVRIDDFWTWAKMHQNEIDFSQFPENSLGAEPEWVKNKRRIDAANARLHTALKTRWSPQEDALLTSMCQRGTTWRELDRAFNRSSNAIRRRIYDLGLPKPERQPIRWTQAEIAEYHRLKNSGYSDDYIARRLNRSSQSVRGLGYNLLKGDDNIGNMG